MRLAGEVGERGGTQGRFELPFFVLGSGRNYACLAHPITNLA
jgi:hypothetical protein